MTKWKCPDDAGPGVSIGGEWFENVDGVIETPDGEGYAMALAPHGYTHLPPTAEELAAAAAEAKAAQDAAAAQAEADAKAAEEAAAAEAGDTADASTDGAADDAAPAGKKSKK